MIICDLLATGRPEAIETAIDICLARYKLCEHLLVKQLAKIMRAYGIEPLERLPEPSKIIDVVAEKVRRKMIDSAETESDISSIVERRIAEKAARILVSALYSVMGSLGVECSLG